MTWWGRRKKKRKTPKTEREILIDDCDALCSIYTRLKHGKCQRCEATKYLQDSHIITRRKLSTRWNLKNRFCLCLRCHLHWWHKSDPFEVVEWSLTQITRKTYDKLKSKSLVKKKYDVVALKKVKRGLKKKLQRLEGEEDGGEQERNSKAKKRRKKKNS